MQRTLKAAGVPPRVFELVREIVETCSVFRTWTRPCPDTVASGRIVVGLNVEVEGDIDANDILVATKVDIRRAKAVRATAVIDSVDGANDSIVLLGITVNVENGVTVVRGHIARKPAKAEPKRGTVVAGTGRTLWLFDQNRGRLSACRVRDTSTVGLDVIRCTRGRPLP